MGELAPKKHDQVVIGIPCIRDIAIIERDESADVVRIGPSPPPAG